MQHIRLDIILNLSIIIPALAGLILFKNISKLYRLFIFSIFVGVLNEYNAEFNWVHFQYIESVYTVVYTQLILFLFFIWDVEKISNYKKILLHSSIFLLTVIDQYYDFLSIYHIKWGMITSMVGISLYGIRLLTQVQNNLISSKASLSRKLIIIPYMVFSVYYATINILMYFLFNETTKDIFMDLYNVIRWINFLSYISYTLALIWAPKKEKFL